MNRYRVLRFPLWAVAALWCVQAAVAADSCETALAPGKALKTYQAVLKALDNGDPPATIADIECLVPGAERSTAAEARYQLVSTSFNENVLHDFLERQVATVFERYEAKGSSAILAWRGGYLSETALTAYERTGDTRFLDLFVDYFTEVLSYRDDKHDRFDEHHGRVMKSWGEERPVAGWFGREDRQWVAHVTHAARIALAPAKFARMVSADPALAAYRPTADVFLTAAREAVAEFAEDCVNVEGLDGCWYERPMTEGPEATNHIHTLASVLIHFAALDDDPATRAEVDRIADVFERGVQTAEDGTVHWKYFPYFADQTIGPNGREYSERIWKASQTVPFVYRAYSEGYDVPEPLVAAIVDTFLTHIIRGDRVMRNISPVESREIEVDDEESKHIDGIVTWLEFVDYEPEIAERIRHLVAARPDLFKKGWFETTSSARGYAHFLGDNRPASTPESPASGARPAETLPN
ncbi:hypothetical protein [Bauldia sp.]|uniref:hypothetical protein n=1 Tax=Bauldia sp. TaxID=2575872 RepID=UPI003BA8561A